MYVVDLKVRMVDGPVDKHADTAYRHGITIMHVHAKDDETHKQVPLEKKLISNAHLETKLL